MTRPTGIHTVVRAIATSAFPIMLALAVVLLPACGVLRPKEDPTRSFVLRSTAKRSASGSHSNLIFSVGPTVVADYLDHKEIVSATGSNELDLAEFSVWAEPLDRAISQVVAKNLGELLNSARVFPFPEVDVFKYDYKVGFWVKRFERDASGSVAFDCSWALGGMPGSGGKIVSRLFKTTVPVDGNADDYGAIAAAMSEALERLSEEVHREIVKLPTKSTLDEDKTSPDRDESEEGDDPAKVDVDPS
jgi:uncharacterized lipoprotein YmbA